MKMLFAVNVGFWNPPALCVVPSVLKSKELNFIGLYDGDKENVIEHMVAEWIVDIVQTRDVVFKPSISTYTDKTVAAWTLFLNDVSYAFLTTKNDVTPEVRMALSFDDGRLHPDKAVELIKWDLETVQRLLKLIDQYAERDTEEKLKEKDRSDLN